ncbi:MAG TPA: tRNA uridine-5-carboxymethylaminomethyl(34) synthesis GTPase MnmE, partial [Clostridia bacterium]|nr:tRNA uridine-5-carboxymethylaminomethyl(34) synthesis GTPase MnmE [Clostridia bacterium]
MEDTIYAPSSAIGGAIAVIRVSGDQARRVSELLNRDIARQPRKLTYVKLQQNGELIDECMAAFLPAPGTYTGEDMAELNCHGGMQTIQRALAALGSLGF